MISKLYYRGFLKDSVGGMVQQLEHVFNIKYLERAHENEQHNLFTRENDQSTSYHKKFYEEFTRLLDVGTTSITGSRNSYLKRWYLMMIKDIKEKMFDDDIVFQAVPTFRVHLPGNVSVGEFHKDTDYGHNSHAINFWVPLTRASKTAGVLVEVAPNVWENLSMIPGDLLIFDAMNCLHGNVENEESYTRMSIDFRVIPKKLFVGSDRSSINTGLKFDIGGYYSTTGTEQ